MKVIMLLAALALALQSVSAQEPSSYKPEDLGENDVPPGMTAEEYIKQVYEELHYKMKVTFRVVGEDGNPIPNADINVGIDSLLHADGHNNYIGKTNAEGLFTVESRGRGCTDVQVTKDGYYLSRPDVRWSGKLNPGGKITHENGGLRPWNPTIDVILKKVGEPIPMIVRRATGGSKSLLKPGENLGKDLGWDLVEGDWVAPHGKGKVVDLVLKFDSTYTDKLNHAASVRIGFGNHADGLIAIDELQGEESLLKYPRTAPEDGYEIKELKYSQAYDDGALTVFPKENPAGYQFRLRTKVDENGEVTSALYGKITKPFELNAGLPAVHFDYYLNPTPNDRNLEYDRTTNLASEKKDVKDQFWPP